MPYFAGVGNTVFSNIVMDA